MYYTVIAVFIIKYFVTLSVFNLYICLLCTKVEIAVKYEPHSC